MPVLPAILLLVLLAAPLAAQRAAPAPTLLDGLGDLHWGVTATPEAQRWFDQGLRLLYAFNHEEAARSFREGERLDPRCAMCAWGEAYALGPNINAPMDSATGVRAREAARRAEGKAAGATPLERELVTALVTRYGSAAPADRARLDSAYARAMGAIADRHPDATEAQVLHAEALMDLSPWSYWNAEGTPRPDTPAILARLEGVIARQPGHPGACHFYIHAVEAKHPARAVECAERLAQAMPAAGHLVHMPAHIYIRVGRWSDAIEANRHAVHADHSLMSAHGLDRGGMYGQGYVPHNWHFLGFAASMAGQSRTAIEAAREGATAIDPAAAAAFPPIQWTLTAPYTTLVTFARWDEVLAEPLPAPSLRYATAMAFYARGVAFVRKGRPVEARAALDTVRAVERSVPDDDLRKALGIAALALEGEMALGAGEAVRAATLFRRAVAIEDGLGYMEPPTWYYPVRQSLGRALLEAKRPVEAERVYREDLARFPENGWSLTGLALSLDAQGKRADAAEARTRLAAAWREADVKLAASRF